LINVRRFLPGARWLAVALPPAFVAGFGLGSLITGLLPFDASAAERARLVTAVFGSPSAPVGQPGLSVFGARDGSSLQLLAGSRADLLRLGVVAASLLALLTMVGIAMLMATSRALRRTRRESGATAVATPAPSAPGSRWSTTPAARTWPPARGPG